MNVKLTILMLYQHTPHRIKGGKNHDAAVFSGAVLSRIYVIYTEIFIKQSYPAHIKIAGKF